MKADEVALTVLLVAGGIVVGFIGWTYLQPLIASQKPGV